MEPEAVTDYAHQDCVHSSMWNEESEPEELQVEQPTESCDIIVLSVEVGPADAALFAITGPCILRYCIKHGYGFRVNAGTGQTVAPTVMLTPAAVPWPELKIEPYRVGVDQPAVDLRDVPARRLMKIARRSAARWET